MSRTIDEKVVEMRFDNKQFESNVATSMSTLEKLKRSLKLDGASKGLEDIDKASKKVDMSGLGGAVESVKVKFSALDVVAVTALANITNSAVNAGKQLVKSLSVDQLSAGFQKFSDKTTSVATLVAQGNAIEDVNEQLDRLNWFTDETSYNFTEMVSNIAKFTATGKGLNESVTAMEGIATWAALSGQNAATASRAMYQLSQAMGAGTMRLEDFRSIQNASMDTEEFRKKCIEAAISLETLQDNGDGTYTSLVEGASGASWSISQFASNLTSEMWLTSDVMMKVFNEYSSAVEGIYDAAEEKNMLASEIIDEIHDKANELKTGTEATSEDIDAAIRALGYTLEDGSLQFDSFGLKAFEAAQKARTFQDAIDSVKDAVSTGWMNTFQLIFGDAEQATAFWTDIANLLWDMFAAGGETRNQFLELALNFAKPWEAIEAKLNGSIFGKIKDVAQSFENVTDQVQNAAEKLQYFQDVVNRVWNGDFNNHGDNPDRYDLLTKAGYDWRVVQDLVNKGYQYKLTIEDVEASHKKFGLTMGLVTEETKDATEATEEAAIAFEDLTDAQLIQARLTKEEIDLYRAFEKEAKRLDMSVSDLAEEMSTNDGRTLLLDSFKNALQGIMDIGTVIKSAWKEIFNPPGIVEMAVRLYGIIKSLNEFSQKLILVDADTGELNETGQKLQRTFKGIFAILDIVRTVIGGGLRIAFNILTKVLSAFNLDILDVTANIGDALVAFRDWILEGNILAKSFDWLISKIPVVVNIFKEWFNVFKQTPAVQKLIDAINAIGDSFRKLTSGEIDINEFARSLGENVAKVLKSLPGIALQIGKDFIEGFKNGISDSISGAIKSVIRFCLNFVKGFAEALGVQSPSWKAFDIAVDFFRGLINGAKSMLGPVTDVLKKIGEVIVKVFKSFWDYITDESGKIEWGKLFAGGSIVGLLLILKKFADVFSGVSDVLEGVEYLLRSTGKAVKSFSKVLNAVAFDINAKALQKLAIAVAILVASIWVLTQIDDTTKLRNAAIIVGIIVGVLVALAFAMSKLSSVSVVLEKETKKLDAKGLVSPILQIGLALLAVAAVVKIIGDMSPEKAAQGFKGLAAIAVGMLAFLSIMGLVSRYAKNVTGIGGMMVKLSLAMILMVGVCKIIGSLSGDEMLKGVAFATAFAIFVIAITKVAKSAGNNVGKVGGMIIKVTIAMALMVGVCKLISLLSVEEMLKGAAFAAAFAIFVAALVRSAKMGKKQQLAKIGGMILSISASLALMVGVCKLVGMLSVGEMIKGAYFVAGFVLLLKALISILTIGNEQKIAKVTGTIFAMSAAIGILAAVSILLGFVDLPSLAKGVAAVTILSAMMALMVRGLKEAQNVKGSIIAMTVAIGLMAAAVAILSFIDTKSLISAAGSMAVMMAAFALMIKSLKGLGKEKIPIAPILVLTGVIVVLAGVIYKLKDVDPKSAIASALSLAGLLLVMTGVLKILSKIGAKAGGAIVGAIALAALGLVLREFVWVLASMDGLKNARANAITLSILAVVCTGLIALLSLIGVAAFGALAGVVALAALGLVLREFAWVLASMDGLKNAKTNAIALSILAAVCTGLIALLSLISVAAFGALAGVVALAALGLVLREFVWVLASMDGLKNARDNAITLSILATVCTVLIGLLAIIGIGAMTAIAGVVALAALGLVLREFVWVLASMEGLKNAKSNAIALSILAGVCTVALGLLTIIGFGAIAAIAGVVALAALGLVLREFVWVLASMEGLKNATTNATILTLLMTTLADVLVKISLLGPLAFVGEAAIAGLIVLIGAIGTMAVAIGALMEKFPAIQKFLDSGLPILEQLAGSIGKMIGNFIGGIGEGLSGSLIKIGDNIAEFMDRLATASDNAAKIKADSFNGVEKLMGIMAVIGAETVGTSITDIFTRITSGGTSMDKFEKDGVAFFNAMKAIGEASSGVTLNEDALDSVVKAAEKLAGLQSSIQPMGGVIAFFAGTSDLGTFGLSVAGFIWSMKTAFAELKGVSDLNTDAMDAIIKAATDLSTLQQSLENIGGVVDFFKGRDDLGRFGVNIIAFIDSMLLVFAELALVKDLNTDAMDAIIKAATRLSTLQQSVEDIGGVVDWFKGRDDLGKFGQNVANFIDHMKMAMSKLNETENLNEDALDSVIKAAERLSEFQKSLDNMGGVIKWFKGRDDLGKFGENLYEFARAMGKLKSGMGEDGISEAVVTSVKNAGNAIIELQKALPTEGLFDGKMNLSEFSKYVDDFATAMSGFITKTANINSSNIETAISAANRIRYLIESLVGLDTSGLTAFTGIGTGGRGADGAAYQIAQTISEFSSKVSGISIEAVSVSVDAATKLKSMIYGLSGLDTSGIENFKVDTIADQMKTYSDKVSGIDTATISASVTNAERLKSLIAGLTSLNTSGISNFNVSAIGEELKKYHGSISSVDMSKISSSISEATRLKSFISSINNVNLAAVSSFKAAVDELSQVNMAGVIKAFTGSSSELETAGASVISSLVSGMRSKLSDINNIIRDIMSTINASVTTDLSAISTAGKEIAAKLAEGFSSNTKSITTSVSSGLTVAVASISLSYTAFYNAGSYLVTGFCNGISDNSYKAAAKAKAMAEAAVEAAREALKINSPSKVFKAIGSGIPEGFAMGIGMLGGEVEKSVTGMASSAINTTRSAMANVLDALNNDMDTQPRIRPVVDLSNVQTGVNAINGMFDGVQTVGISSSFNAINASMNRKLQNGTNDDVISAINKLRTGLDNNRGDTYNFGDFTYDSGSEVADAVGTLIRYARIGRRV